MRPITVTVMTMTTTWRRRNASSQTFISTPKMPQSRATPKPPRPRQQATGNKQQDLPLLLGACCLLLLLSSVHRTQNDVRRSEDRDGISDVVPDRHLAKGGEVAE